VKAETNQKLQKRGPMKSEPMNHSHTLAVFSCFLNPTYFNLGTRPLEISRSPAGNWSPSNSNDTEPKKSAARMRQEQAIASGTEASPELTAKC